MKNNKSFTLAEVLISLVIIGIIAAITVPMIMANHKKVETSAKLKKFHTTMANAMKLAKARDGELNWIDFPSSAVLGGSKRNFDGIWPQIKDYINYTKYEESATAYDYTYKTTTYTTPKVYLSDGSSFVIGNVTAGIKDSAGTNLTGMAIDYDVNGDKGPNQGCRDIFTLTYYPPGTGITSTGKRFSEFDPNTSPSSSRSTLISNIKKYINKGYYYPWYCFDLMYQDGWEFKDDYPIRL